jgi:hypothetical protein
MRDTIDMAREAGFTDGELAFMGDNFRRFADFVRADEREACAKLCDAKYEEFPNEQHDLAYALSAKELAAAIRNRGNT